MTPKHQSENREILCSKNNIMDEYKKMGEPCFWVGDGRYVTLTIDTLILCIPMSWIHSVNWSLNGSSNGKRGTQLENEPIF